MRPEEIVEHIDRQNRSILSACDDCSGLTRQQVLDLMNAAALRGFQYGGEMALSTVQGMLTVQQASLTARRIV